MRDESQACAGNRSRDVRRLASDEPVTRWCEDDGWCGDLCKRGHQIDFAELARSLDQVPLLALQQVDGDGVASIQPAGRHGAEGGNLKRGERSRNMCPHARESEPSNQIRVPGSQECCHPASVGDADHNRRTNSAPKTRGARFYAQVNPGFFAARAAESRQVGHQKAKLVAQSILLCRPHRVVEAKRMKKQRCPSGGQS
jgi:hypothetical protein